MGQFQGLFVGAVFSLDGFQIRRPLQNFPAVGTLGDIVHLGGKRFFCHGQRLAAGRTDPRSLKDPFPDLLQNDERYRGNQKEQGEQPGIIGGDQPNHHSGETHSRQNQKAASCPGGLLCGGDVGFISLLHTGVAEIQKKGLHQFIEVICIVHVLTGELVIQIPIDIQLHARPGDLDFAVEPGQGQAVSGKYRVILGVLALQALIQLLEFFFLIHWQFSFKLSCTGSSIPKTKHSG